jgi:hypothetical protein
LVSYWSKIGRNDRVCFNVLSQCFLCDFSGFDAFVSVCALLDFKVSEEAFDIFIDIDKTSCVLEVDFEFKSTHLNYRDTYWQVLLILHEKLTQLFNAT